MKNKQKIIIYLIILILAVIVFPFIWSKKSKNTGDLNLQTNKIQDSSTSEQNWGPDYSGIQIKKLITTDLKFGSGPIVQNDSKIELTYKMWVYDPASPQNRGRLIKKSYPEPTLIALGKNKLIPGFEQGLVGVRVGGERQFIIPPELAYGDKGYLGEVPPKAIILVEAQVISIK